MRLIDADALYEKTAEWEAQALHMVDVTMHDEDKTEWRRWSTVLTERSAFKYDIADAPTVQVERDMPMKPIETTDRAWGIPKKQAVCPRCDYYLGHVAFLGDYKGKRITYCETCGQAIDWEGWDFDETY